jgi:nucleoid DNA-binding protein
MTLTKAHIVEAVAEQNGYPKNQSFEMIETLLEIIKRLWNPVRMSLSVVSGNFVSRQSMNAGKESSNR